MKRRACKTILVIVLITFSMHSIVDSKEVKRIDENQERDTHYYWWGICVIIGVFTEKSYDDTSYISQIVTNHTWGIAIGLLRDNEHPENMTGRILCFRDMTVRIPDTIYSYCGYIGKKFLCVLSRDCDIR